MASNYPGSLDSFDTIASDKKTSDSVGGRTHRDMHNDLGDAIESVQTELGTDPSGSAATVSARLDGIEAGTRLGVDSVTAAQIAANAVGSSELADNAVDTTAIADSAVTSAKIADGTITSTDVAAGQFAAFSTVGNLLTANQASIETDTTGWTGVGATLARTTGWSAHGSASLRAEITDAGYSAVRCDQVAASPGDTYTALGTIHGASGAPQYIARLVFVDSGSNDLLVVAAPTVTAGAAREVVITGVAPADTVSMYVLWRLIGSVGEAVCVDRMSLHRGAGGQWAMPGVPVPGQSRIAVNNAVDLSGTGTPEGVITAAPGSTWLQTDATTDVKGWIRWVKATGTGNTGWVAGPEADTGWRKILSWTSGTQDGANQIGTIDTAQYSLSGTGDIRVRRIGQEVFWWFHGLVTKTNSGGHQLCGAVSVLPSGFRMDGGSTYGVGAPLTHSAHLYGGFGIGDYPAVVTPAASVDLSWASSSHYCANPWPASLPGVAGT